jgi:uncharacterized GH25 family protein
MAEATHPNLNIVSKWVIAVLLIAMILPVAAFAHGYWLEPDSFFLNLRQSSSLHLFIGEGLKMDEEATYQARKTNAFQMFSAAGRFDMRTMAEDESKPVVKFSADNSSTFVLTMERDWSYITLEADKFEEYLKEEGMEYVIAERVRLGESKNPGKERYSRFLKTLIQVGANRTGNAKTRIGARLEIVPLDNPYSKKAGDDMDVQVFFGGRPLAGKAIFADNRDGQAYSTQKLTTDHDGRITLKLNKKGVWLVRLVYMQRCERNCGDAEWESFWGAMSFGVK